MEKIKSIISGHKKSEDVTHDTQTSPTGTGAHHESQATPIYDSMKDTSSAQPRQPIQPTSAGTSTSAGQTGTATGLGQTQHRGAEGSIGAHNPVASDGTRPDVNPRGAGYAHEGVSEASIKSGVIGFGGTGQPQQHAALSSHNPESGLDRNQILGGGNTGHPSTTATSEQPSVLKQALPLAGNSASDQTYNTTNTVGGPGSTTQGSTSRQPFDQSLRQESYTNDTDRSFPLAGGIAPKHDSSPRPITEHHTTTHQPSEHLTSSTHHPIQQASSTHQPITSEREPGTKERAAGVHEDHGRQGLAAAAAAAATVGASAPFSEPRQHDVQSQGQETRQATYGDQPSTLSSTGPTSSATSHTPQAHHPEALAAATAAASKSSTLSPSAHSQGIVGQGSSFNDAPGATGTSTSTTNPGDLTAGRPSGHRTASHPHIPGEFPSPTPDESKTFLYYRQEVIPEPGVDGPVYTAHKGIHPEHQDGKIHPAVPIAAGSAGALAGSHDSHATPSQLSNTIGSGSSTAGPHQSDLLNKADPRVDSDLDGSRAAQGHGTNAPIGSSTAAGVPSSQHELRHTGSLEQPRPRSSEFSDDHHYGRNAAIAGGIGAGAAGLGYAATRDRDAPNVESGNFAQESSPYSSKQLDPRALGSKSDLEQQRYNPATSASSHPTSGVAGVSSTSQHPTSGVAGVSTTSQHPTSNVAGSSSATQGHHTDTLESNKSTTGPHKSSLLNKLDPRVKDNNVKTTEPTTQAEPQSHHGRDAALVGGGVATAAGARHALQRNDTPGAGTAILPDDQTARSTGPLSSSGATAPQNSANTSAPLSSSTTTAPQQSSNTTAPLSSSTTSASHHSPATSEHTKSGKPFDTYHGPKTTSGSPFYGAVGAPAPVEDLKSHQPTSTSTTSPLTQQHDKDTHHGRDAGLAGAGLATAGGLAYASQRDDKTGTTPASATIDPHSSNVANVSDPRVQPDPANQKAHTTTGPHQSDTLNRVNPNVDETAGQRDQHHYGRDAALVGGAGALGGAAYAGTRHGDNTQAAVTSNQPLTSTAPSSLTQSHPTQGTLGQHTHDSSTAAYPTQGLNPSQHGQSTAPGTTRGPLDSTTDPRDKDHTKRDAALLGTGAAAAGGAAYAYSQNQDADRERARMEKEQHEREKEHARQEKDAHKLEKEQAKHDKEQHKHDKAIAAHDKAEHKHEKEQEKEAARLEKEREKEAKRLEKENEPEKKHGILGFLHRDKSKKEKSSADNSPRQSGEVRRSVDNKRHSKEYAAGGAALGAGTTAAAYDDNHPDSPRRKGRNVLHKDPPPGHPARESLDHHELGEMQGGNRQHMGVDGPIGDPNAISGYQQTKRNTYGAVPISEIPENKTVIEPRTGLPMNVGRYGDGHGGTDGSTTVHGYHGQETGVGQGLGTTHGGTGQGFETAQGGTGQGFGTAQGATGQGFGTSTGGTGHGLGTTHGGTGQGFGTAQGATGQGLGTAPGGTTNTDWNAVKKADTPY